MKYVHVLFIFCVLNGHPVGNRLVKGLYRRAPQDTIRYQEDVRKPVGLRTPTQEPRNARINFHRRDSPA